MIKPGPIAARIFFNLFIRRPFEREHYFEAVDAVLKNITSFDKISR
jgi:hypothetical protein